MKKTVIFLLALSMLTFSAFTGESQVTITPTSVFISDGIGVESVNISNYSETSQEVRISFAFSYPGYDEAGNIVMVDHDSITAAKYGLGESIKAFPRSFVLPPNGQQLVRLQVRPMRDKADGTYWSRIIISSNAPAQDLETVAVADGVGTRINYIFNQNIPVFYKKGKVTTGLEIKEVNASFEEEQLVVLARLVPKGNSPYNGSVNARLLDNKGNTVSEKQTTTVVYFEALRRVEIPLPEEDLPSGKYTIELLYQTQRRDVGGKQLVQADPVKFEIPLNIGQ